MGYLYLGIALASGAVKGYCGKRTSGRIGGWDGAMAANLIRMLLCIGIGLVTVAFSGCWDRLLPDGKALAIYALSGISTTVFVVSWLIAVRTSAYVLMNVFLMLGVAVPMVLGSVCYGEPITWKHWAGLGVLLAATLILCAYNNGIKQRLSPKALAILLLCGVANGVTGFSQKLFQKEVADGAVAVFNFYTYVFSGLSLGLVLLARGKKRQASPVGGVMGYLVVMALALFLNSWSMTAAAASVPAAQLYPLNQGASLILSGLMSAVFFGEKLTGKAVTGLVMAFFGLLLING